MNVREWMNNHPAVITSGVVVALLISLGVLALQFRGRSAPPAGPEYYLDLETDTIFVGEPGISPIQTDAGGQAVKARLFACDQCNPEEWFGFVERYSDEAKALLEGEGGENAATMHGELIDNSHFIRGYNLNGDDQWVLQMSDAGERLQAAVFTKCATRRQPLRCTPTSTVP